MNSNKLKLKINHEIMKLTILNFLQKKRISKIILSSKLHRAKSSDLSPNTILSSSSHRTHTHTYFVVNQLHYSSIINRIYHVTDIQ